MRNSIVLKPKTNAYPNISRAVKHYSRENPVFKTYKITDVIYFLKTITSLKKQGLYLE